MDRRSRTLSRSLTCLLALALLATAGGSQCNRNKYDGAAVVGPRVLTETPSVADITQVVNANAALIRSLYTTDATMSVPGAPSLRANLALEREKKLRLRAETAITGAEVDMGSNDELFWFWVRRNPPPTLYYCRHDKFATSAAKQIVPVDPDWLLDAVGLATFDPYHQHTGPVRTANGNWEILTTFSGPQGTMTKKSVVDSSRGFVLEQHMYDDRGTLVASALASRQWRDPATGAIVPTQIKIVWPATQFSLEFDVKQWRVNSIPADPTQLFTMPNYPGWAVVDLSSPNAGAPPAAGTVPPAGAAPPPTLGNRAGQPADLIGFAPQYPMNPMSPYPQAGTVPAGNRAAGPVTVVPSIATPTGVPTMPGSDVRRY